MGLEHLSQLQGLLPRSQGALGDFKFAVERPKLEVGRRDVRDQ